MPEKRAARRPGGAARSSPSDVSWKSLRFSPASWPLAFACLLGLLLAKGLTFLPAYSIDDYSIDLRKQLDAMASLRQARFGEVLLLQGLRGLGFEASYSHLFFVAFGFVTWATLGVLLVRHWGLRRRGWLPVAVAGLVVLHPYTTEIFTFRSALATISVALALFSLLLLPRRWNRPFFVLGSILFALALSVYQGVLHFAVMIATVGAALWLGRWLARGRGYPRLRGLRFTALLRHRQVGLIVCVVSGTVGYALTSAIVLAALNVKQVARGELLSLAQLPQRWNDAAAELAKRLWTADPLIPAATRGLLLALLVVAVVQLLRVAWPWRGTRLAAMAWALALLAVSLFWTFGLLLVLREFWPTPRLLAHLGVFWAGALALAHRTSGPRIRRLLAILVLPILLSFVGSDNRILAEQRRVNARDAALANRIVGRLEGLPGLAAVKEIAVVGGSWTYPQRLSSVDHDMNISAFGAAAARAAILREISGFDLREAPKGGPGMTAAETYCRDTEPWPAPGAVGIRGSLAIVCLAG